MPSQLLHILFGEDVISQLFRRAENRRGAAGGGGIIEKIRTTHRNAFALGCQGPDIFYHSRRRRPVGLEYGTLLHRRGFGLFTAGLLELSLPDSPPEIDALGVYALGFMTHAFLDRLAHPYIVYKSCRLSPPRQGFPGSAQAHTFFERIIDALMFKYLRGKDVSGWDQEGTLAEICLRPPPGLQELLGRALVLAFPERAGKDEKLDSRIQNTFQDCAGFYRMTSPANVAKESAGAGLLRPKDHLVYVYPRRLPETIDFLNMEKRPWLYPAGEEREDTRSFPQVYAGAVAAAVDSLSGITGRWAGEGVFPAAEAAGAIGNGGLSITDAAGAPCPPTRTAPLPLDDVLEQEFIQYSCQGSIPLPPFHK
ncbi:MAG: zinc dependent phospholipase C family protein [Treponema sp.]|nr:zinc dependent phospholipase C family protein [Treponema sp.]